MQEAVGEVSMFLIPLLLIGFCCALWYQRKSYKTQIQQLQKMHNTFEYDDKAEGEMQIVVGAPVDYKQPQSSKRDHHAILQDTPSSVNIEEDITQSGLNLN